MRMHLFWVLAGFTTCFAGDAEGFCARRGRGMESICALHQSGAVWKRALIRPISMVKGALGFDAGALMIDVRSGVPPMCRSRTFRRALTTPHDAEKKMVKRCCFTNEAKTLLKQTNAAISAPTTSKYLVNRYLTLCRRSKNGLIYAICCNFPPNG